MEKSDKKTILSKDTLIPIGFVIVIVTCAYFIGTLASRVQAQEVKDSPSRTEYNTMCERLNSIDKGISDINSYLRDKR